MANKKTKDQIDSIRGDLAALTEAVWALKEQLTVEVAAAAAARSSAATVAAAAGGGQRTDGHVRFRPAVDVDGPAPELAAVDEEGVAQILHALGHRQRLGIVKTLLHRPASAADLVEALQLGTTGAAYHHLNVLLAANLVVQQSRGVYAVDESRLPGIIGLLNGAAAAMDPALSATARSHDGIEDELLAERSSG